MGYLLCISAVYQTIFLWLESREIGKQFSVGDDFGGGMTLELYRKICNRLIFWCLQEKESGEKRQWF